MNGITRKKIYEELSQDHGEYCQFCGKRPEDMQLVIDHIDNNNSNNAQNNLRLLCRRCNYIKNPRRPVDECVSENRHEETSELQTSRIKKPKFMKFLFHMLNESDTNKISENDFLNSVAEELDISQITAKRWLLAKCSSVGILQRIRHVETWVIKYKSESEWR